MASSQQNHNLGLSISCVKAPGSSAAFASLCDTDMLKHSLVSPVTIRRKILQWTNISLLFLENKPVFKRWMFACLRSNAVFA